LSIPWECGFSAEDHLTKQLPQIGGVVALALPGTSALRHHGITDSGTFHYKYIFSGRNGKPCVWARLDAGFFAGKLEKKGGWQYQRKKEGKMRKLMIIGVLVGLSGLGGVTRSQAADSVAITGEVVDTYCYVLMEAKGESHRSCGIDCVNKGIPAGLLEKGSGKLYVLLPDKDKSPVPKAAIDKMGRQATITGKVYSLGGSQFLTVESVR
jgi:hypothetical protein